MDDVEAAALTRLGEQQVWTVDNLPAGVDADVLRCLDVEELVQARIVIMSNPSKYRGDPSPWIPMRPQGWFSPIRAPDMAGNWDQILSNRIRDERHHPYEIRLSERGRAELARMLRARAVGQRAEARIDLSGSPAGPHVGSGFVRYLADQPDEMTARLTAAPPSREMEQKTDWRDVQRRLLELYERGDTYTSIGDLAKRLGCAKATIQKAIKDSAKLKGWQARHTNAKGLPRASSLTEIVLENAEQTREPDPAAEAEAADVDIVFARLIQEAKPQERAQLNCMSDDERRRLVGLMHNDPDQYDRILGRTP